MIRSISVESATALPETSAVFNLDANKSLVRAWIDSISAGDQATMVGLLDEDMQMETMGSSVMSKCRSRDEMLRDFAMLAAVLPNGVKFQVRTVTAEDDRVSVEVQGHAISAQGLAYDNQYHFMFVVQGGKIRVVREYVDTKLVDEVFGPAFRQRDGRL
jgi:ketosteroid isomerase-like protein